LNRQFSRTAILLVGPAGAGKTTICLKLLSYLHLPTRLDIGYVSGDWFSACQYPRTFDNHHLSRKYEALCAHIRSAPETFLIIDDLFRRRQDFERVCSTLETKGFTSVVRRLSVPVPELIRRNALRLPPARMPVKRLIRVNQRFGDIDWSDISVITNASASTVARRIARDCLVVSAMLANFPTPAQ